MILFIRNREAEDHKTSFCSRKLKEKGLLMVFNSAPKNLMIGPVQVPQKSILPDVKIVSDFGEPLDQELIQASLDIDPQPTLQYINRRTISLHKPPLDNGKLLKDHSRDIPVNTTQKERVYQKEQAKAFSHLKLPISPEGQWLPLETSLEFVSNDHSQNSKQKLIQALHIAFSSYKNKNAAKASLLRFIEDLCGKDEQQKLLAELGKQCGDNYTFEELSNKVTNQLLTLLEQKSLETVRHIDGLFTKIAILGLKNLLVNLFANTSINLLLHSERDMLSLGYGVSSEIMAIKVANHLYSTGQINAELFQTINHQSHDRRLSEVFAIQALSNRYIPQYQGLPLKNSVDASHPIAEQVHALACLLRSLFPLESRRSKISDKLKSFLQENAPEVFEFWTSIPAGAKQKKQWEAENITYERVAKIIIATKFTAMFFTLLKTCFPSEIGKINRMDAKIKAWEAQTLHQATYYDNDPVYEFFESKQTPLPFGLGQGVPPSLASFLRGEYNLYTTKNGQLHYQGLMISVNDTGEMKIEEISLGNPQETLAKIKEKNGLLIRFNPIAQAYTLFSFNEKDILQNQDGIPIQWEDFSIEQLNIKIAEVKRGSAITLPNKQIFHLPVTSTSLPNDILKILKENMLFTPEQIAYITDAYRFEPNRAFEYIIKTYHERLSLLEQEMTKQPGVFGSKPDIPSTQLKINNLQLGMTQVLEFSRWLEQWMPEEKS